MKMSENIKVTTGYGFNDLLIKTDTRTGLKCLYEVFTCSHNNIQKEILSYVCKSVTNEKLTNILYDSYNVTI